MKIGCVVKASGASTRFGSNKLLAPFLGKPLLAHLLEALPGGLARTLVVTRDPAIAALAEALGRKALVHALPGEGDSIRLGMERMLDMDGCLFCVGDQPLLTTSTLENILQAFAAHPQAIVRVGWQGQPGNPVLFPRALFPGLCALTGQETGNTVLRAHGELVRLVEAGCRQELMDIDTPEELRELENFLIARKNL